jgi:hypothetical protein
VNLLSVPRSGRLRGVGRGLGIHLVEPLTEISFETAGRRGSLLNLHPETAEKLEQVSVRGSQSVARASFVHLFVVLRLSLRQSSPQPRFGAREVRILHGPPELAEGLGVLQCEASRQLYHVLQVVVATVASAAFSSPTSLALRSRLAACSSHSPGRPFPGRVGPLPLAVLGAAPLALPALSTCRGWRTEPRCHEPPDGELYPSAKCDPAAQTAIGS